MRTNVGTTIRLERGKATLKTDSAVSKARAALYASWFAALGEPNRIRILHELALTREGRTIGELARSLGIGQSTLSHHVARLAAVRFVSTQRLGTSTLITLNRKCIAAFPEAANRIMRSSQQA